MRLVEDTEALSRFMATFENKPREGIHVSDVVGVCLRRTLLDRVHGRPLPDASTAAKWGVGLEWEEVLTPRLYPDCERQVHVELDGIVGTVDFVDKEHGVSVEAKATWHKPPGALVDVDVWRKRLWWVFSQHMGYTKMLGKTWGRIATLYVNGMDGDLRWRPGGPELRFLNVYYSQSDLDHNWEELRANKALLIAGGRGEKVLPGAKMNGICGSCPHVDELTELPITQQAHPTFPCDGVARLTMRYLKESGRNIFQQEMSTSMNTEDANGK